MAVRSKNALRKISLESAYQHVREWYLANSKRAFEHAPNAFLADRAQTLITSLPATLSPLEMRAILHEVMEGLLDWGAQQSDGQFLMSDYARAGLESSGGERFTMDERSQLQGSSLGRVLIQDYHKDQEEQRSDGYERFDASARDAAPTLAEAQGQGLQRDVEGVGGRRFPNGAPERGFAVRNEPDAEASSVAEKQSVAATNPEVVLQPDAQASGASQPEPAPGGYNEIPLETLPFTSRCQRVLVSAAGYSRNRRQPQSVSLSTSGILYALVDLALLAKLESDDATIILGNAIREAGAIDKYQSRRQRYLKQELPVTIFDNEPLSNALANVSLNTRTLLLQAQQIAQQTTAMITPVDPSTLPIDTRHLIAAMLTAFPSGAQRSGQLQLVSYLGLNVGSIKNALYSFVSQHFPSTDFLNKWSEILKGASSDLSGVVESSGVETFEPFIAGYISDSTKNPEDDLGIGREVRTLCSVILAKDVSPPLSIGLFGDWGTGKTFFMERMREEIDFVKAQEKGSTIYSKFHTRVAQITFNAWHYVDANLWASLVSHILEKLVEEIAPKPSDEEVRKQLVRELQTAKELKADAEQEKKRAADEREAAEKRLSALAEERARKQVQLSDLRATDLWHFVAENSSLKGDIDNALQLLGLPSVLNSVEDLDAAALEARGIGGRLYSLGVSLIRDGNRATLLALMGILLVLVPALAWWLSKKLPGQPFVATLSSIGTGLTAVCVAIAGALRGPLRTVNEYVGKLETARKNASDLIDQKRSERSEKETTLEGEVNALKAKEASAAAQLSAADTRVREVEAKIHEIDEGRNLAKFILARSEAGDYRKHLGLISTIRQDFENLSKLLQVAAVSGAGDGAIQRIVLYVDDLDRCPSDRVVELLEAVHLLLAFDLFVVVVGVDPRWLLHSLQAKFSAFQTEPGKSTSAEASWGTTPQDYLEKIFQIPFSLRRMESTGFSKLMHRLLPESVGQTIPLSPSTGAATTLAYSSPSAASAPGSQPSGTPQSPAPVANITAVSNANTVVPPGTDRRLNQESLNLRAWETDYACRLAAFIPTPRGAKRFTNIYRLLKAPLDPEELSIFEGTPASPGEFRAPMLLLAILTGFPYLSVALFGAIRDQNPLSFSPTAFFSNIAAQSIAGPDVQKLQNCLNPLVKTGLAESGEAFVRWIPKVARFSFYTSRITEPNA
jgi:hypothetical protein